MYSIVVDGMFWSLGMLPRVVLLTEGSEEGVVFDIYAQIETFVFSKIHSYEYFSQYLIHQ